MDREYHPLLRPDHAPDVPANLWRLGIGRTPNDRANDLSAERQVQGSSAPRGTLGVARRGFDKASHTVSANGRSQIPGTSCVWNDREPDSGKALGQGFPRPIPAKKKGDH